MSGECVLVVDDNPANLKLMTFVLKGHGYEVVAATDATETFKALETAKPAAILLDIQLPGIDGYEIARRLKADATTASIPIIAVTAFAMKGDDERARMAGCDGYVTKPIDTRGLPGVVAHYVARAQSRP